MSTYLLALPGIQTVTPTFLRGLVDLSARHGWDPNGIALVISEESGFNPAAKNPNGSASGLIQFIESTANRLGTTTAQIRAMTAEQQLPLVERFFASTLGRKIPQQIEDYVLASFGQANLIGAPDSTVMFAAGSPEYAANQTFDSNGKGAITVGDVRAHMRAVLSHANGVVEVPDSSYAFELVSSPKKPEGAPVLATIAVLGMTAIAGYVAWNRNVFRRSHPMH